MLHTMNLAEPDFNKVVAGDKTLELRLYNTKRAAIQLGDIICFESRSEKGERVERRVDAIHRAQCFEDLFGRYLRPVDAGFSSLSEMMDGVRRFYSEDEERASGVICFGLATIESDGK